MVLSVHPAWLPADGCVGSTPTALCLSKFSHEIGRLPGRLISFMGGEYGLHDLQPVLGYAKWDRLECAIKRVRESCSGAGEDPDHHILRTGKMIEAGKGAQRSRTDYFLSRYGAYLLVMNGDTSNPRSPRRRRTSQSRR